MKKALLIICCLISTSLFAGDADLGKAKSATCTTCHGMDGNSVNPAWPKIGGQHADFTTRQLKLFASGERTGTVMNGMVAGLTETDMENLGAYYATFKMSIGSANEDLVEVGRAVYQGGSKDMKIPACMACHGASGKGIPLSGYPALAGQHAPYIEERLKAYRSGERMNSDDVNGNIMADVAKYLTDEEIKAVASYLHGLYSE